MFGLGVQELLVIALIIIIFMVLGTKKLPDIGKGLGNTVRELRNIESNLSGTGTKKGKSKNTDPEKDKSGPSIESMVAKNIIGRLPGVRRVMFFKDKVDRVKKIIK